jgi:hypothetical protein
VSNPPQAQRSLTKRAGAHVQEVKGSHAVYVSQPSAAASLIEKAAQGCGCDCQVSRRSHDNGPVHLQRFHSSMIATYGMGT